MQLFGQVDSQASSRSLAALAIFSASAEVRRVSTEILKTRDPREFANLLIALLRDPIKYEVRPVGGPGSPGVLFVQGEQFNVQRLYSPSALNVALRPGTWVGVDDFGLPVIHRYAGTTSPQFNSTGRIPADAASRDDSLEYSAQYAAGIRPFLAISRTTQRRRIRRIGVQPMSSQSQQAVVSNFGKSLTAEITRVGKAEHKAPSQFGFVISESYSSEYQIPIGQMMIEAQKTAIVAQQQLADDVAIVDAYNNEVRQRNDCVSALLAAIAGKDLGQDARAWKAWWVNQLGYSYSTPAEPPKPTLVENVPLAYQPQPVFVPRVTTQCHSWIHPDELLRCRDAGPDDRRRPSRSSRSRSATWS